MMDSRIDGGKKEKLVDRDKTRRTESNSPRTTFVALDVRRARISSRPVATQREILAGGDVEKEKFISVYSEKIQRVYNCRGYKSYMSLPFVLLPIARVRGGSVIVTRACIQHSSSIYTERPKTRASQTLATRFASGNIRGNVQNGKSCAKSPGEKSPTTIEAAPWTCRKYRRTTGVSH